METNQYRLRDSAARVGETLVAAGIIWAIGRSFGPDSARQSGIHNVLTDLWAGLTFHAPVPVWVIAAIVLALLPAVRRRARVGIWWPLSQSEKEVLRLLVSGDGQAIPVEAAAARLHVHKLEASHVLERLSRRGLIDTQLMGMHLFYLTTKGTDYVIRKGYVSAQTVAR